MGETIRRITGKVAVELISERARALLEPVQLGVRTPNGCEAIIHATRQWFHRHRPVPTKTAVSVDISNAFNTVDRLAVLRSVRTHFPSLAPWVDCCYRHDSHLFTGSSCANDRTISSSRSVQQGDPLGRVLFALAIHPPFKRPCLPLSALSPPALISVLSFLMMAYARETLSRLASSSKRWSGASVTSAWQSTWAKRKSSPLALPLSPSDKTASQGAAGIAQPASSYWGLPSVHLSGVNSSWSGGSARLGHSSMQSEGSPIRRGPSVC